MGREFIHTFDAWAPAYDWSVLGGDPEYREAFRGYESILDEVANHVKGTVIEFGVGTGNLSRKLLAAGVNVYGIEPSAKMRALARQKLPDLKLSDGDFLDFLEPDVPIDAIVSSYAFHHLTDEEKRRAIGNYARLLPAGGKIVFADTLFDHEQARQEIVNDAARQGYHRLVKDLETEYYSLRGTLEKIFEENGFEPQFKQMNTFVWLITAVKRNSEEG